MHGGDARNVYAGRGKMQRTRSRRGQVLVVVAIALLALLAFVALAVDGGNVYEHRRLMQNAADAGALAGAQEICFGDPDKAVDTARDYAVNRNGADNAYPYVTDDFTVTVITTKTVDSYFAGLIGYDVFTVTADASALCGVSEAAGPVWPVAFRDTYWPEVRECGQKLILWMGGSPQDNFQSNCTDFNCCKFQYLIPKGNGNAFELGPVDSIEGCNEEENLPPILPLDKRTWADLSAGLVGSDPCDGKGCGANELKYRLYGCDGCNKLNDTGEPCQSWLKLDTCISGDQGEINSAYRASYAAKDEIRYIPLYDPCRSGDHEGDIVHVDGECEEDLSVCTLDKSIANPCTSARLYITGLTCLKILGPARLFSDDGYVDVIIAEIPCEDGEVMECATPAGWTSGKIPEAGDIRAVSLIK